MYGLDSLFHYFSRRAQQEQVAAINARGAAAAAHQQLADLHTAEALRVLTGGRAPETVLDKAVPEAMRLEHAGQCC